MVSVERMRPLLGTFVTIRAELRPDQPQDQAEEAVERAFRAMAQVDRLMSFHRSTSDVSRINRCRPGRHVRVHSWTHTVLRAATELSMRTAGDFDCNVGGPLMRAKLLPKANGRLGGRIKPAHRAFHVALALRRDRTVRLRTAIALDLGGIAKGFAVDKAVQVLKACGMAGGTVNAGGDLRVFGSQAQAVWIRDPAAPGQTRLVGQLTGGAIATSAAYFTAQSRTGRDVESAIVNRKRHRVAMAGSVSVAARTCMLADALTKVAVLRGRIPSRLARRANAFVLPI